MDFIIRWFHRSWPIPELILISPIILTGVLIGGCSPKQTVAYDLPVPRNPQKIINGPEVWITDFNKDGIKERIAFRDGDVEFKIYVDKPTDTTWNSLQARWKSAYNLLSNVQRIDVTIDDFNNDGLDDLLIVTHDNALTYMNEEILSMFPLTEEELEKRVEKALE